jgi:tRNA(His) guanylyltransferase
VATKDPMGDRIKMYEGLEAGRHFMPLLPICIRLDGRSFSRWTKGLDRPYDERLHRLMVAVTAGLVIETNACIGYTQSDEISLVLYSDDLKSQVYFDGRIQKIVSSLSSLASVRFHYHLPEFLPDRTTDLKKNRVAMFDCRAWTVPNQEEAVNTVLWREFDATKNSVSQAARCHYSHNQLMNKSSEDMQDMLFAKGVNWNDYPAWYKRGTYIQRGIVVRPYTAEEIEKLPPKHYARVNPELLVSRHAIRTVDMPPLARVVNRVDVIFNGADPETAQPDAAAPAAT